MARVWILRIWSRPCVLGTPISISRSKRPGRRSAGSRTSGMFVAPITITWPRETNPSIRLKSCATTRFSTSPTTSARLGATASISSMKRIAGAWRAASEALEDARVLQRQLDDLAHARDFALEAADVLVRHGGRARRGLLAFDDADVGARADDDGSAG